MNKLFAILLKKYDGSDKELLLKAKFVLALTVFVLLALLVALIYTVFFDANLTTIVVESSGIFILLSALVLLTKGHYNVSVHTILITAFSITWIIMFTEPADQVLIKLDTIVYIPGIMSAMPLLFLKGRRPIIIYFLINLSIFAFFNYHIQQTMELTFWENLDYLLDNTIVMFLILMVSFSFFTIYRQVLDYLKKELMKREKAEKKISMLRIFLSNIIDSMPSAIIGVNKNFEIVLWNKEASRLTNVSDKEAKNKNLLKVFVDLTILEDKIQTVIDKKTILNQHKIALNCQDKKQFMDITIYPFSHIDTGGAIIRIDDISERLKMEEVMVHSEKMLSIGGLAAGMAHEINNPLAGMIQNAQVVHNRLTQSLPANDVAAKQLGTSLATINGYMEKRGILKQLAHIQNSGKQAAKIVDNMLSFVRKTESNKKENNISELIDKAIALAQSNYSPNKRFDFKNVSIVKEFQPDCSSIYCESSKIQQVLFNILKNAAEAISMQKKHRPPAKIIIRAIKKKHMIFIEIEDNGPGMDETLRKRIFEPFFTTKKINMGTGLGLSVSYFIITEDHRGTMEVESIKDVGTKFIIGLPCKKLV